MSLNYTTLQAAILDKAVHPELTTEVVEFIRNCEALMRRKLKATEYRTTLDESDRSSDGIYTLPSNIQRVRVAFATGTDGESYALDDVGIRSIHRLPSTNTVKEYAVSGRTIEFRGVPATDAELELVYFGWPDALSVTATNELLDDFEDIYLFGSLHYLYQHTQDIELAQASLGTFTDAVSDLNKLIAARNGGGAQAPAYNFGHIRIGRGY